MAKDRVLESIDQWAKRLIDLTARNPLLHSGPNRRRLTILEPSPEKVWSYLLDDEKTLLPVPKDLDPEAPDRETLPSEEGENGSGEYKDEYREEWLTILKERRWGKYPRVRVDSPADRLLSSLVRVHRRVITLHQDAGFWTLFLAFGLLRWRPGQRGTERYRGETWESPILLLPVVLERKAPGEPFLLSLREEEEVQFNLALRVYLEEVERVSLPEGDASDLAESLKAVREVVRDRGWTVEDTCWLNLFSFHKMAMYQDLKANAQQIARHPVVEALAGLHPFKHATEVNIDRGALDSNPAEETATVLPADSSQLEAVLRARRGESFLIHGPPGTGKSQTIVNIIADAVGRGKSVLFVSEKRAALEVVLRRLRQVGLEPFCLDLHDYKTRREQIVKSIDAGIGQGWQVNKPVPSNLPSKLELRRKALSDYVTAVHTSRPPLNRTPYQVIGQVTRLPDLLVSGELPINISKLTETKLAEIVELARACAPLVDLAREGAAFPWWGIKLPSFSEQVRSELLVRVRRLEGILRQVREDLNHVCPSLGLRTPRTMAQAKELHDVLTKLWSLPSLPPAWTRRRDERRWLSKCRAVLQSLTQFEKAREQLPSFLDTSLMSLDTQEPPLSARQVREIQEITNILSPILSEEAVDRPVSLLLELRPVFESLYKAMEQAVLSADDLRKGFGFPPCANPDDLTRTVILAKALVRDVPLEEHWLQRELYQSDSSNHADSLKTSGGSYAPGPEGSEDWSPRSLELTRRYCEDLKEWQGLHRRLVESWREDFLELNAAEAWDTWHRWRERPLRFLAPSYRRLKRFVRNTYRGERPQASQITESLQDLLRWQELRASLEELQKTSELKRFLGNFFHGWETDPDKLTEALDLAQEVVEAFPALPPGVQRVLTGQTKADSQLIETAKTLLRAREEWIEAAKVLRLTERIDSSVEHPSSLVSKFQEAEGALERLSPLWDRVIPLLKEQVSLSRLALCLGELHRCLEGLEGFRKVTEALQREWEWLPEATLEAWRETLKALKTWGEILSWVEKPEEIPEGLALAGLCRRPEDRPSPQPLDQALGSWEEALRSLGEYFKAPFPRVLGKTPFNDTDFSDLGHHLQSMKERVEEIQRYLDLRRIRDELARRLSSSIVDALIENQDLRPEELPGTVEKLLLTRWLEHVFLSDPVLNNFRWEDHQRYVDEFRDLDAQLEFWTVERVVESLNDRRGRIVGSRPEVHLIRKEANKRRRHLPIRRLIRQTFNIIVDVKPCWLMSPLSISHFLLPDNKFDLVIFDEASQVRVQDAVTAIYRANQVIICGDPKQLPPTTFFEAQVLDESVQEGLSEESDDELYTLTGESVLDALGGVLPSVLLQWHYRSRDESLIMFSNKFFYGTQLVTFPTPEIPGADTGIQHVYLPTAVYERGGRRVNRGEVDKVCELVREHLDRHLNRSEVSRSLGVVTMNEPQKNALLDELERRTREDSKLRLLWDLEKWPNGEGFFVKSLEEVQGDERDVVIVSTTYGRGPDERLTMQFGPLTQSGGERRLNVLVTRAREKVILVTSLRPEDIRLSDTDGQEGLRALRAYLQFARDKELVFTEGREGVIGQNYESEFEASVADVLRSWGYEVIPQYGVGPYRIDLVVRDPLDSKRVQVAIECDGASYHRLPTVRERDRIRQEWLQRQGWEVVRVWSTEWWRQRRRAEERLRKEVQEALQRARDREAPTQESTRASGSPSPSSTRNDSAVELEPTETAMAPDLRTRLLQEGKVRVYDPLTDNALRTLLELGVQKSPPDRSLRLPRIADPNNPSRFSREFEKISTSELDELVRVSAEALAPCILEYLLQEVAKLLGFKRRSTRVRERLQQSVERLISEGVLTLDSDQQVLRVNQTKE